MSLRTVPGSGFASLSKKFGVPCMAVRDWVRQRLHLTKSLKDPGGVTRKSRSLKGGGSHALNSTMEKELHKWIVERNKKGL